MVVHTYNPRLVGVEGRQGDWKFKASLGHEKPVLSYMWGSKASLDYKRFLSQKKKNSKKKLNRQNKAADEIRKSEAAHMGKTSHVPTTSHTTVQTAGWVFSARVLNHWLDLILTLES